MLIKMLVCCVKHWLAFMIIILLLIHAFFIFSLLQPELAMVLYPMFVHMYLELVYKGSEKEGTYNLQHLK